MLSGVEHVPSDEAWRRVGESALPILMELYGDRSQPIFLRLRALAATAAFVRIETCRFLLGAARERGQRDLLVREAVLALARAFGADARDDVASFLSHREPIVREAAAHALVRIGGSEHALSARLAVETDRVVREVLERGLSGVADRRVVR